MFKFINVLPKKLSPTANGKGAGTPVVLIILKLEFSINFSEKFHASLCDEERTPITKQMISHIETRAQDIARLKQLKNINNEENS